MKVQAQTNPQNHKVNQTNPQPQPQNQTINQQSLDQAINLLSFLLEKVSNSRQQINSQGLYPNELQNKTSNTFNNDEFIIKASMKASYVALKIQQLLTQKKKITLSALGFAMSIAVDSTLLVKKDMSKQGREVKIDNIELFEKEVADGSGRKKILSGIRISISI